MKRSFLFKVILFIVIILSFILIYIRVYNKIQIFNNAERTVSSIADTKSSDMIVDVTNIVNDAYPEHEHVWYDEYDETNHWSKCSICKEVKNFAEHELTTTWALGKESCDRGNSYTTTCLCGYGFTGRKPHVWNGVWESNYVGYNYHDRRCINCNKNISTESYIDNTKGGVLIPNTSDEKWNTGLLGKGLQCILSDGTVRPCGSSQTCNICKGPKFRNSSHSYVAIANNKIICQICGKVRWNI